MSGYATKLKVLNDLFARKAPMVSTVAVYEHRHFPYEGDALSLKAECESPESVGISSEYLTRFYTKLESEKTLNMHTVTIARNGKIISKGEFFPYKTNIQSVSHSLSKSVVSLCVGLLYDDGIIDLDEKVIDIFSQECESISKILYPRLTVRHLLTMSSGASFDETGSVIDNNWINSFLESVPKFSPGREFHYNSMNTYMLSAIVKKKTGKGLAELLKERVFCHLDIKYFSWEKCPMGIEKGGWGLYMYPQDVIKLGQLVLDKGVHNGVQIISKEWVDLATSVQMKTPDISGNFDYGFQMWINPEHNEVLFNGMFGQNLHLFKRTRIMVMTTAGNGDIFQRCRAYDVIEKFFGKAYTPNSKLSENLNLLSALREKEQHLCKKDSIEERILDGKNKVPESFVTHTNGRIFATEKEECAGISVYPILAQATHNNFRRGIEKIGFSYDDGDYYVSFFEEDGEIKLKVGFEQAEYQTITLADEPCLTAVYAKASTDEDGYHVLNLVITYPELPNVRHFKIYFYGNSLKVKCSETPGYEFMMTTFKMILDESVDEKLVKSVEKITSKGVSKHLEHFLKPTIYATEIL